MRLDLKDFKQRIMKYIGEDVESVSMDDVEQILNFVAERLKEFMKLKRESLVVIICEIALILSLTILSFYYFKGARYGWLSLQVILIIWNLFNLNKSASKYSEVKEQILDARGLMEITNLIKNKKIEQAAL